MPNYADLQLLQLALQEQARNGRQGVTPSALAQNAYFGSDLSRGNESRREQDLLDLRDADYAASVAANRKRTEGVNDVMAGDEVHRFNTRKNATVLPDKPLAFTPENFGPVASHAQPTLRGPMQKIAPDLPMASEDSAFGDVTPLRTIKRAGTSTASTDPDAAMSAAQRAMLDPRVIASEIGAGGRAAAASVKTDAAAEKKHEADLAAKNSRQQVQDLAQEIMDHPAFNRNVGPIDDRFPVLMADSQEFQAKVNQLRGLLSLENRQKLKGSGAISNFEQEMLANAATALTLRSDEPAAKRELTKIIEATRSQEPGGKSSKRKVGRFDVEEN